MREVGQVVDWNESRGFGFVKPGLDPDRDLFFHRSDCLRDVPRRWAMVSFERDFGPKGLHATAVEPADEQESIKADVRSFEGTVLRISESRRYGFITSGGHKYFFHGGQFEGDEMPEPGTAVRFEPGESDRGLCALRVRLA